MNKGKVERFKGFDWQDIFNSTYYKIGSGQLITNYSTVGIKGQKFI